LCDQPFSIENGNGVSDLNSDGYYLYPNYPNPFNRITEIRFYMPKKNMVSLKVLDLYGRIVATLVLQELAEGEHTYSWDACDLPSGIFLYQLQTGSYIKTRKLILQN
jgi:hypothetical protein